jgi:hypothetical protein
MRPAVPRDKWPTGYGLRRFTLGSGPLKPTSDRLECLARILLVCSLLLGVAIALAVATAAHTQAQTEATAQAADRHQVSAVLREDASPPRDGSGKITDLAQANVSWTEPSGAERTQLIFVAIRAKAGSTVSVWVDREGNRTTRPLDGGDAAATAVGYGLLTYVAISMAAFGAYYSFRKLLDRSRSRRWEAEWAVVGPVWTGKVP